MWKKEWKAISIFNFAKTQISWKWFFFKFQVAKISKSLFSISSVCACQKYFWMKSLTREKLFLPSFFLLPPTTTSAAASLSRKKSENDWQLRSALFVRAALIKNLVGGIRNKKITLSFLLISQFSRVSGCLLGLNLNK